MKVLVATKQTQDKKRGDFCYADEDELVYRARACSECKPNCRCRRALAGTRTRMFTTTVQVSEKPYFIDEIDLMDSSMPEMRAVAELYETGTILEVRTDGFLIREGNFIWQELFPDE